MLQRGALPIWSRLGIWLIMPSKMARLTLGKVALNQEGAIFQRRKKAKSKPCTNKTHPISPEDTIHIKTIQTTNHTIQPRVTKPLLWLHTIHPLTKYKPHQYAHHFQIANQTSQGITTLQLTRPTIIFDPHDHKGLLLNQSR